MIPQHDPRWKVGGYYPVVEMPLHMPPPKFIDEKLLWRQRVFIPYGDTAYLTEPVESQHQAIRDGEAVVKKYVREHFGGMAKVIALVEWDDPFADEPDVPQYWSAVYAFHTSDT